jgi:predicted methyltransferase
MRASTSIALALALVATPLAAKPPVSVATAVASSDRSSDNVKLDESRKPAEVLKLLGLKPGMTAIDLFGGNKYWPS